jgi:hypothetical protein
VLGDLADDVDHRAPGLALAHRLEIDMDDELGVGADMTQVQVGRGRLCRRQGERRGAHRRGGEVVPHCSVLLAPLRGAVVCVRPRRAAVPETPASFRRPPPGVFTPRRHA